MPILQLLPYVSVAALFIGIAYKLTQWLTIPSPFPLTAFPAPARRSGRITDFLKKILLFENLFSYNRLLWLISWPMHLSLALIILGHIAGIYFMGKQFTVLGLTDNASLTFSYIIGMAAGIVFFISLFALLIRRLYGKEERAVTALSNYFELGLLIGIALTGIFLRLFITEPELVLIREYIANLVLLRPTAIPDFSLFIWHFVLINILVAYLPYSKLIHCVGGIIIRIMLSEPPPQYPTPTGKALRSSFANPADDSSLHPFIAAERR